MEKSVGERIWEFMNGKTMHMREIAQAFPDVSMSSMYGRIHENVCVRFEKVGHGMYRPYSKEEILKAYQDKNKNVAEMNNSLHEIMSDGKPRRVAEIYKHFSNVPYETLRHELHGNPKLFSPARGVWQLRTSEADAMSSGSHRERVESEIPREELVSQEVDTVEVNNELEKDKGLLESLKLAQSIIESY